MTIDTYDVLRRQAAVAAMQTLIQRPLFTGDGESIHALTARVALNFANALVEEIKQHELTKGN